MAEEMTSTVEAAGSEVETSGANVDKSTTTENKSVEQVDKHTDNSAERIERIVQSRVDKAMAEERKKNAGLQRQLEKLTKEKLSDNELKQLEISEREKTIEEREKALLDRENRLYAIKAIKSNGLDDGSDLSLELVDLVMDSDTKNIDKNIKSLSELVKRIVSAKTDELYKANGRVPNGANNGTRQAETKDTNIAAQLGKTRAEQAKKSNDILNYYLGGKR